MDEVEWSGWWMNSSFGVREAGVLFFSLILMCKWHWAARLGLSNLTSQRGFAAQS